MVFLYEFKLVHDAMKATPNIDRASGKGRSESTIYHGFDKLKYENTVRSAFGGDCLCQNADRFKQSYT